MNANVQVLVTSTKNIKNLLLQGTLAPGWNYYFTLSGVVAETGFRYELFSRYARTIRQTKFFSPMVSYSLSNNSQTSTKKIMHQKYRYWLLQEYFSHVYYFKMFNKWDSVFTVNYWFMFFFADVFQTGYVLF